MVFFLNVNVPHSYVEVSLVKTYVNTKETLYPISIT